MMESPSFWGLAYFPEDYARFEKAHITRIKILQSGMCASVPIPASTHERSCILN